MTRSAFARRRPGGAGSRRRGFTLVELLVSVSMSMAVAVGVFALAGQGVRTFSAETRMGDAHVGALTGFERLREDISRAGLHVTPNIQKDPRVCGPVPQQGVLANLAAVQIIPDVTHPNGVIADTLTLAGAYDWHEQFRVQEYQKNVAGNHVFTLALQGADARLREKGKPITDVFRIGQILRVVTPDGNEQYLTISGLNNVDNLPMGSRIVVTARGTLYTSAGADDVSGSGGYKCGVRGQCTQCLVNPVNVIRYKVDTLGANPKYKNIYASKQVGRFYDDEPHRVELVRVELDAVGDEVQDTEELIAEYVVGLDFGIFVAFVANQNGAGTQLDFLESDDGNFHRYAGIPEVNNITGPQLLRGLRTRLSVRSRQADRRALEVENPPAAYGFPDSPYGIQLGTTPPAYARVRNVQSDIALNNLNGMTWQ